MKNPPGAHSYTSEVVIAGPGASVIADQVAFVDPSPHPGAERIVLGTSPGSLTVGALCASVDCHDPWCRPFRHVCSSCGRQDVPVALRWRPGLRRRVPEGRTWA